MAGSVRVTMTVNGAQQSAEVEPRLLLVHFLRETLGLTGTHVGCDTSNCGACTVHLNGEAVKSCTLLAVQADGAEVKTIEGMGQEGALHPLQEAFWEHHGLQCGYCTPGMIMASADLLRAQPEARPSRRSARRSRATSAAARATTTSSRPSWPPRKPHERHTAAEPWVGQAIKRKEDPRLIMGRARYIDDINVTGQLWARSSARPRRTRRSSRSTRRPRRRTPACTPSSPATTSISRRRCRWPGCRRGSRSTNPPHWPLAKDEVHHVGDPVALVIGEDRYAVVDAAEQVSVEYEPLPVVTDIETALEDGADLVHADLGTNKCHEWSLGGGDLEAGFAAADVVVERRVVNHRTAGAAIEPRGVLADYRAGPLTLTSLHPGPALPAAVPRAAARDQRGADPRDRARGRRRLRLQAADLRRGDRARVGVTQARAADQVDRDALGGHAGHPPRPRPDRVRADRRDARRQDHRVPREDPRGPGRLPDAADADDPVARARS